MNVFIEILEFLLRVKNKILRIKDITRLNIEYITEKNICFRTRIRYSFLNQEISEYFIKIFRFRI